MFSASLPPESFRTIRMMIPIVQTAVIGKADALCTLDRHIHHVSVQRYCADRRISVLTDRELLAQLRPHVSQTIHRGPLRSFLSGVFLMSLVDTPHAREDTPAPMSTPEEHKDNRPDCHPSEVICDEEAIEPEYWPSDELTNDELQDFYRRHYIRQLRLRQCPGCGEEEIF